MRYLALIVAATLALAIPPAVAGDDAIVVYKSLAPEAALEAAQAAMKKCRDNGYQIAVAVVDRSGQPQVMLPIALPACTLRIPPSERPIQP